MSESIQVRSLASEQPAAAVTTPAGLRVDAAHVLGSGPPAARLAATASTETVDSQEAARAWATQVLPQLRAQGRQLAQLLQERQQDLDRRESQLHAQSADLDSQMRAARVWLAARLQELTDRAEQLAEREQLMTEAASRLSAAEAYHEAARQEQTTDIRRREADLARQTTELDRLRARLDRQAAAQHAANAELVERRNRDHDAHQCRRQQLEQQRGADADVLRQALVNLETRRLAIEQEATAVERRRRLLEEIAQRPSPEQRRIARDNADRAEQLTAREQQLAEAEQLQARAAAELIAIRQNLDAEREQLAEQARYDRRRQVEAERAAAAATAQEREALHRQQIIVDDRQASLDRVRAELSELYGAALEARLAAEETLARLAGAAPPAEVSRALAETRARLADHWRIAAGRVTDERARLSALSIDIAAQSRKLAAERDDLTGWVDRRQQELDQKNAALAEREESLRDLQRQILAQREEWDRVRLAFEQQLRRGMAERRGMNEAKRSA